MDRPFGTLRKFVFVAAGIVILAVGGAFLLLGQVARKAADKEVQKKEEEKAKEPPGIDPYAAVRPEDEQAARGVLEELEGESGDWWPKIERARKSWSAAPASRVLALVKLAEGAPDRRARILAAVARGAIARWVEASMEENAVQQAWRVFHKVAGDTVEWRIEAVRILAAFPPKVVGRRLFDLLAAETDPRVRAAIVDAFEARGSRIVYPEVLAAFEKEPDPRRAAELAWVLAHINRRDGDDSFLADVRDRIVPALRKAFDGAEPGGETAVALARAMAAVKYDTVNNFLLEEVLREGDKPSQLRALAALGVTGREEQSVPERIGEILRAVTDKEVLDAAQAAIQKMSK